ncbi:gamma-glutamylcyclotransferase [Tropicimonas sediminicola]|uniref:glutathione-specific gamma-glutamylcyclotransferase n=1 Tax=Tropicimonas sediminicola TaxID=1031541 RepID=A0A239GZ74_9RHOB|nr:gamma-glutamylcyclotransferase [Tropicimonas sediminicola]SNS74211.1 cation transport protein ChaC [Tropicimonas sediminicola]
MTARLRLSRELVERLPSRVDERGPVRVPDPPPEYYPETATRLIDAVPPGEGLWVFAAGSLIWNPRFEEVERRAAMVHGWRRAFCYHDARMRGSPKTPGRMLSLDRGGACGGFVIRMAPDGLEDRLVALLKTEPPVPPKWVRAESEDGAVRAIAFTASPDFPLYDPEPPLEELADTLAAAVGHLGSMAEYILNTVLHLDQAGIHDPHLWQVQDLVAERLERLG